MSDTQLFDADIEREKLSELLHGSLGKSDDKWINIKNDTCKTEYKMIKPKGYTYQCVLIKSEKILRGSHMDNNYFYNYYENSNMKTNVTFEDTEELLKVIDKDRCIIYRSNHVFSTSKHIYPRDWCYIRTRFKVEIYPQNIKGLLVYSITNKNHPFYIKPKSDHVRGIILYYIMGIY